MAYFNGLQGFEVAENDRRDLELFVESRAVMDALLRRDLSTLSAPSSIEIDAERSRREAFEALVSEPVIHYDPLSPTPLPGPQWWKFPERKAPITSVEERKGLGGWYDEAVATGQHKPGFFERVAVSIVRAFFPDSAPTTVITRADGTVEIILGGGAGFTPRPSRENAWR